MTLKYLVKYGKLGLSSLGWLHQPHVGYFHSMLGSQQCEMLLSHLCHLFMTSPLLRISIFILILFSTDRTWF